MLIHPLYVRPALPGEDVAALKLLRDPHRDPEENLRLIAIRLELLEAGQLDPDGILACIESATGQVVGCLLVQSDSPNSALAWPPGVPDAGRRAEIEALLFDGLRTHAHFRHWTSVMAFLDEADGDGAASLMRGGFEGITHVRELARSGAIALPEGQALFEWVEYPIVEAERFAELFGCTLVDSLDCPELNDLKSPAEILEGYGTSAPDRSRWWLIRYRDVDIGTVILCDGEGWTGTEPGAWEIAFMGLIPEARGAGLGRQLLHEILTVTSRANVSEVRVRCDERNHPAARIYADYGFQMQRSYRILLMRKFDNGKT